MLRVIKEAEPRQLTALVRGELDWVVMKALEKDRYRNIEDVAARRIRCGVSHWGDQTTRDMGKLSGRIPQASRHHKRWRSMWPKSATARAKVHEVWPTGAREDLHFCSLPPGPERCAPQESNRLP
jgi:hypothetical protein